MNCTIFMVESGVETESPNFQPGVLFIFIAVWSHPACSFSSFSEKIAFGLDKVGFGH